MRSCVYLSAALLFVCQLAVAQNWPNWRGPNGNGVVADSKDYPTTWNTDQNVQWSYKLPGRGGSTPAIWGDNVFLTFGHDGLNTVACLSTSGQEKWSTTVGKERPGKHKKASGANSSPVTDGKHVFVYFKSGDVACLDTQGKIVWQTNLQDKFGEDTLWWDLGTSPVLTKDFLVIAVVQSGPSYIVAFDKEDGSVAWKQDRNLGAPEEAAQTYASPVVVNNNGEEHLVVLGADHVTCHQASNGEEVWRVGGLNPTNHKYFRSIASPAVGDGVVICPYARGDTITAVNLNSKGDITDTKDVLWTEGQTSADVPTPIVHKGKVYVCRDKGELVCRDLKTGAEVWKLQVEKNRNAFSASPIIAGGHLYVTREDGTTFVVSLDDPSKVAAKNELGEFTVATPAFVGGKIYLRTYDTLYCIGK